MTHYELEFGASLSFNGSLEAQVTSVEQLLDQEPFSPEIREWLRNHPEVRDALKIIIRNRFVPTHAISIVDNPALDGVKQSIGIYSIDMNNDFKIKQDYLMHETNDTFVLFTGIPRKIAESEFVQPVSSLEQRYGPDGKNYWNNHHPKFEEIPTEIRPYADRALNEARKKKEERNGHA